MDEVHTFLLREGCGRVLKTESGNCLFECLSSYCFRVEERNFYHKFKTFMERDGEKILFKCILQLLDNTGQVPIKSDQETDRDFQSRLERCYQEIIMRLSNILPNSNFLQVYVFAIATLIGRPIYILNMNENDELAWSYFPPLYSHTFDEIRRDINYTARQYITMYFSETRCFMIESHDSNIQPKSYGCLGLYKEEIKGIFSSLEHEVLGLSYCDHSPSNGVLRLSVRSHFSPLHFR